MEHLSVMPISSRTPEGDPNRCTVCGKALRIEPSLDTRDAPCPHCGHLLWFESDVPMQIPEQPQRGSTEDLLRDVDQVLFNALMLICKSKFGPASAEVKAVLTTSFDERREVLMKRVRTASSWEQLTSWEQLIGTD
jgi:predicted RNA-binding Zn-ribbon protein involved in translation (DUF1610 family)